MTRAIGADASAWSSLRRGAWGQGGEAGFGLPPGATPGGPVRCEAMRLASPEGIHWLGSLSAPGLAPVTPGRLVGEGGDLCRDLLRPAPGQGLVAFSCDKPPARGLVASLAPGELALALRNGLAAGLSVESLPLEALAPCLLQRLGDFGQLGGARPEWALGLDIGQLSGADRQRLSRLSAEFRLGVQDLGQGIWVLDRLGGLHAHWPPGVRFQPG